MLRTMTIDADSAVAISERDEVAGPAPPGCMRWIDLEQQDAASLALLADRFRFHPLTIEDCLHFDQRPKLETYEGYIFLVVQGFHVSWEQIDDSDAIELHMFVSSDYVVTVHDRSIPSLDALWNRISHDGRLAAGRADHLCYLIVDSLVDSYFPLIDELHLRLDDLEDRVLDPRQDVSLEEILDLKRLLVNLRKILSPQRDVLALLAKRGDWLISERVVVYFRDVYDHTLRLHESVESARELLGNVRDAHLWNASQRTNVIMKKLTILSAVFLPLTFITGFFGQNFSAMPFDSRGLMFGMLATCMVIPVGMLLYFLRSRWI